MQEQAAPASICPSQAEEEEDTHNFKCEICDYSTNSKHGLSDHIGHTHKEQQKLGVLDVGDCEALVSGIKKNPIRKNLLIQTLLLGLPKFSGVHCVVEHFIAMKVLKITSGGHIVQPSLPSVPCVWRKNLTEPCSCITLRRITRKTMIGL